MSKTKQIFFVWVKHSASVKAWILLKENALIGVPRILAAVLPSPIVQVTVIPMVTATHFGDCIVKMRQSGTLTRMLSAFNVVTGKLPDTSCLIFMN